MFPEDIERLFRLTALQARVNIINEPYKAGWSGDSLYIEVHPWLEGLDKSTSSNPTDVTRLLVAATSRRTAPVDWSRVDEALQTATGIPQPVASDAALSRADDATTN